MNFLKKISIQHPIFLAPMAGISTPHLAAAVSNQGGLGALGLGSSNTDEIIKQIIMTKKLTHQPFQVNFFCHEEKKIDLELERAWISWFRQHFKNSNQNIPTKLEKIYTTLKNNDQYTNILLELRPKVVSFHFGLPSVQQIQALKKAEILTMVSVTQLSEAIKAQDAGIDILVAQGIEAGGHRGIFNENIEPAIFTHDLVSILVEHTNLPVVAAGGIMNGRNIRSMMDLGASAAQLGTAFIQCNESAASDLYRKILFKKNTKQITATISGRPARGITSDWHQNIDGILQLKNPGYPYAYHMAKKISQLEGSQYSAFWAGSNVNQIRKFDAKELMQQLILEI